MVIDLTGQQIGRWTVICRVTNFTETGYTKAQWLCRCSCGTERNVPTKRLRSGTSLSCGCYSMERLNQRAQANRKDRTGEVHHHLTVIAPSGKDWLCRCVCGKEIVRSADYLRRKHRHSCGCAKTEFDLQKACVDIAGLVFGYWTVIRRDTPLNNWLCSCVCGRECVVRYTALKRGTSKSCGCGGKSGVIDSTRHPLNKTWHGIKSRCRNPRNSAYHRYGGRGIQMCDRWHDSFILFVEDVGKKPSPAYSLDRIDNNGHYEPGNVRWATKQQQAQNQRSIRRLETEKQNLQQRLVYVTTELHRLKHPVIVSQGSLFEEQFSLFPTFRF